MKLFIADVLWNIEYYYGEFIAILRRIKWAYQRARYGYDEVLYWELGDSIIETYTVWLTQLIKHKDSHPIKYTYEQWTWLLNKHLSILNEYYFNYGNEDYNKELEKTLVWLAKHNGNLWN